MRSHYQTIPNTTIPQSEQFAIALPNHPKFNYSAIGTVCDRITKPYQILTIVESQQFAIAPFKPSLKNLLTYSHPCTVLWKN
ncbi:MAG: hypothetical protein HC785_20155 [Calothrix sp. CSU_2_0]|nr:hypothetical protein [Calothrix sp. CSU_2_0]